ncbi:Tll0287-like domain-containing protein [Stutzerimonas balearica]|jgi:hypothetical protein|uniref:Tll0287-like domain-containing protein n=1 Tax=Stutzerimonas balearica TaxID=74829 RepID=UPI000E87BCAB|nr:DUF3365 domain-containing protein [Stutzerimonas balearica]MBC7199039.1 DUF3365 domain-containing protein [Stutzerimonas balearica]WAN11156.1 DUF3365 domain-containing protein [Stutzerimonas balearica]HAV87224.1 glutamate synthase [Pseudomonas sp.]HCW95593.1 glutamate synthase [Pseudomonas sp.]
MHKASLIALSLLSAHLYAATPATDDPLRQEAASLIPPFQQQLLATVKQAMASGGPTEAVKSCHLLAPVIASEHSREPWRVGRTALRLRNPDNAPDAWERKVLEQFEQRAAAGEPLEQLNHGEVIGNEYRYMQAIGTGEPCLACHGTAVKPELVSLISRYYPDDQARGFSQGDLRGAFTLRKALSQ